MSKLTEHSRRLLGSFADFARKSGGVSLRRYQLEPAAAILETMAGFLTMVSTREKFHHFRSYPRSMIPSAICSTRCGARVKLSSMKQTARKP